MPIVVNSVGTSVVGDVSGNVATLAALSLADDSVDDTVLVVNTLRQPFRLDKTSSATLLTGSVVATLSGTGRWHRVPCGVPHWSNQVTWYVDQTLGDDENDGASNTTYVKTGAEIFRRLRLSKPGAAYIANVGPNGLASNDVLRWASDAPLPDQGSGGNPAILFDGSLSTTTAYSGTFATTGAALASPNLAAQFSDASLTVATYIGRIVTVTSGAASGSTAIILKDLGANTARTTEWIVPSSGAASALPAPGDTYVIKTYPTCAAGYGVTSQFPRFQMNFKNLNMTGSSGSGYTSTYTSCTFSGSATATPFLGTTYQQNYTGCSWNESILTQITGSQIGNSLAFVGCGFVNCTLGVSGFAGFTLNLCCLQASKFIHNNEVFSPAGFAILGRTGFFDAPGVAAAIALTKGEQISVFASAGAVALYGSGNTIGFSIHQGATLMLPAACTPTLTGTTELSVDGSATAVPLLSAGDLAVPAASSLVSWAELKAAPFNGKYFGYTTGTGTKIIST